MDPLALLPDLDRATARLLDSVQGLSDADISAASLLPGWSRGHVLAHVARNADGLCNLLHWARTGVETPQYASQQARDADIEAGAPRPAAAQWDDLDQSARRLAAQFAQMPADAWTQQVWTRAGELTAAQLVWIRIREVEIHHVDLDLPDPGYRTTHWPDAFAHRLLHELAADFRARADGPQVMLRATDAGHDMALGADRAATVVEGPAHALAGWLISRGAGADLTVTPAAPLPTVPAWR